MSKIRFRHQDGKTVFEGVSGIQTSMDTIGTIPTIFIAPSANYVPVDIRRPSGNIAPETSGLQELGDISYYWNKLFVNQIILGSGLVNANNSNFRNGWGISGVYKGATDENIYIATSGFLTESGMAVTRRFIYPHYGLTSAGRTYKTNGIYTIAASGTATNPQDNKRMCTQYATAASAGAVATVGSLINNDLRPQDNISVRWDYRIIASGTSIIYMGLSNLNPRNSGITTITGDARLQCVLFALTVGETSWSYLIKNTTNAVTGTISNTLMPVDGQWHDAHIFSPDGGSSWVFEVDDKSVAADFGVTGHPTSGCNMGVFIQISPTGASACSFRNSYLNSRVNSPGPMPFTI